MKQVENNIYQISNDAYFETTTGSFVEFGDLKPILEDASPIKKITTDIEGNHEIAYWGANNNLPIVRERLVMDNNIVPELMRAKRDIMLGAGTMLYKERFEADSKGQSVRIVDECAIPTQVQDWLDANDSEDFLEMAAKELVLQANFFPAFRHKAGGECIELDLIESAYIRAERLRQAEKKGRFRIPNWFICGDWLNGGKKPEVETITNFDKSKKFQAKYVRRFGDKMFGGPYYYSPAYWGSRNWIQLANTIPIFHISNLKNGYVLRYHIKFPKDYFIHSHKSLNALTEAERKKVMKNATTKRETFMRKLNKILAGEKNAGRTLYTTYDVQRNLSEKYPGVIVEPIEVNLKDEALLKLFDKSNEANISAQGILPSISGVQTSGKLSSGSDIRNALAFYIAAKTRVLRRNLYAPLNFIGKKNKWFTGELEGCRFGVRDILIATTDKEKTGVSDNENLN